MENEQSGFRKAAFDGEGAHGKSPLSTSPKELREKLEVLLKLAVERHATDLHVNADNVPYLRINGKMVPLKEYPPFDEESIRGLIFSSMSSVQHRDFLENFEIDFSYHLRGYARFRVNALFEKNYLGAAFRVIPETPMTLDQLGVPDMMKQMCRKNQGLVLVTGRTGHGKTSTLAGALQYINGLREINIITIEDPIEYSFTNEKAFIRQREVGVHTKKFALGLKYALRQDPDVIIVGEMRDLETISTALTAAETGHLVFSTLHTFGAVESINRIIDPFPPEQQFQIRLQLSTTLEAVFGQALIPRIDGQGVVLCCEIMIANNAARNIIREGKIHHLKQVIETGADAGMISMEKALLELYEKELISYENAMAHATDVKTLRELFARKGIIEPKAVPV